MGASTSATGLMTAEAAMRIAATTQDMGFATRALAAAGRNSVFGVIPLNYFIIGTSVVIFGLISYLIYKNRYKIKSKVKDWARRFRGFFYKNKKI